MKYSLLWRSNITILAIACMFDLELEQLDVSMTFLDGMLEDQIYMSQQEGFTVPKKKDYVCLLTKSLYIWLEEVSQALAQVV